MPPGFRFLSGIFRRFPCIYPLWASHCPPGDLLPAPGGAGGLYQMYQKYQMYQIFGLYQNRLFSQFLHI